MRTTLTLDPDVAARLTRLVEHSDEPFKAVVNRLLRQALRDLDGTTRTPPELPRRVLDSPLVPGVDLLRLNALADELEALEFVAPSDDSR
ncbi:MAG: hypothetical protein MUF00_02185 [Gemmatimonadaceae bacterium]|jgi:hypothetical protein|nr:hypothetical protein [Gemmatimonadaceae bacterium]